MDMIGHDYGCIELNSWWCGAVALAREWAKATLPQTMFKNKIASRFRQDQRPTCTESDEHRCVFLLQMRKPPAIAVLGRWRCDDEHGWAGMVSVGGRPRPPFLIQSLYPRLSRQ